MLRRTEERPTPRLAETVGDGRSVRPPPTVGFPLAQSLIDPAKRGAPQWRVMQPRKPLRAARPPVSEAWSPRGCREVRGAP